MLRGRPAIRGKRTPRILDVLSCSDLSRRTGVTKPRMLMVAVAIAMCWTSAAMAHDATVANDAGMADEPTHHVPVKRGGMAQCLNSKAKTLIDPARDKTGATEQGGAA